MRMEETIRWGVIDPQGRRVVLKSSTFNDHINKDHGIIDAKYRMKSEEQAKKAIARPHLIIRYPQLNNRQVYYRFVLMPDKEDLPKLKSIKIVVDTNREPCEVVTWVVESKLKGRALEEWIVYGND